MAALADLIDNDADDAEERRKKLEAQQAASGLGAAIGLAIGAAAVLNEKRKDDIREEDLQTTMNMS